MISRILKMLSRLNLQLYRKISIFAALLAAPCFIVYSVFTENKWKGLRHHFGWIPKIKGKAGKTGGKTLWLYALSLGEVVAATPLLKKLKAMREDTRIFVSVTTDSGWDAAHRNLGFADVIFFHPLDCLPFTRLAINRIRPDLFVLTDTGFWPGLLDSLKRSGVPSILFNGRISQKSLERYRALGPFGQEIFSRFALLCMQSEQGAEAVKSLGVAAEKVQIIGDTKYDAHELLTPSERESLRKSLGIAPDAPVWVAGSTHEGEEEIILEAWRKLREKFPDLILILAPRRLERVEDIEFLLRNQKIAFVKRSGMAEQATGKYSVLLLDTLGELAQVYSIADAAFVGRSLIAPGGGHSLIEPLAYGLPVLHGLYIENVRHVTAAFGEKGVTLTVKNADEIASTLDQLLSNPEKRAQLGKEAIDLIRQKQGASQAMAELILEVLDKKN